MSFILDALKKSEIERQRQSVPGLMDTRSSPRRSRLPIWAIALGILLGINLLVLTFVLTKKSLPAAHTPEPSAAASVPAGAVPPETKHFSPLDAAPVYAPEIPIAAGDSAAPLQPPMARKAPAEPAIAALHPARHADPLLTDEDAKADREVLPSISEISLAGAQALPELHLDVHVYATRPAERFVYVNMRKYHEGSTLQEGPTVERIRRDGVVLNYQGLRFILPRQP
ncbi:MAG: ral secretion pathway protein [Gammaproteobacteria bacterium]|jgi:general secretion pathway protein B|nr:ral secretion pathway protein [Gammaproteobacteria bacterium]